MSARQNLHSQLSPRRRHECKTKRHLSVTPAHRTPSASLLQLGSHPRFFIPSLYLTVLSHTGALPAALTLAARAAFLDLQVPKTKVISTLSEAADEDELSGIKAAVRRKGAKIGRRGQKADGTGAEWELDGGRTGGMEGREGLPVLVTLNMVSLDGGGAGRGGVRVLVWVWVWVWICDIRHGWVCGESGRKVADVAPLEAL